MDWSYELLICFSAYSYDEIEEKAKALRRSASHTATDDVSGIDVSMRMNQIQVIFSFFLSLIFFFYLDCFLCRIGSFSFQFTHSSMIDFCNNMSELVRACCLLGVLGWCNFKLIFISRG